MEELPRLVDTYFVVKDCKKDSDGCKIGDGIH